MPTLFSSLTEAFLFYLKYCGVPNLSVLSAKSGKPLIYF